MTDIRAPFIQRDDTMPVQGPRGTEGSRPWPDWLTDSHPSFIDALPFIARHEGHGDLRVVPPFLDKGSGAIRYKWYCDHCWQKAKPQKDWWTTVGIGILRDWRLESATQDPEYYCVFELRESEAGQ